MTVPISNVCTLPDTADLRASLPMRVTKVAHPIATCANFVAGYLLGGGLKHFQRTFAATTGTGTARMQVYRHPNCDYVDVFIEVEGQTAQQTCTIVATAGSGAAQTITLDNNATPPTSAADGDIFQLRCPWGGSGVQEITVVVTYISIRSLAVHEVPRESLTTGDTRVELYDPDYPRIGLLPERVVGDSAVAGPPAMLNTIADSWGYCRLQHLSWWTWESNPRESDIDTFGGAGSSSDIFDALKIEFEARQKRSEDRSLVDFWFYAWCEDGGTTGEIKVTSANPGAGADSWVTSSTFTGTTKAWITCADVYVDCTAKASITIEARRTAGSGKVFVSAISAIGE